MSVRVRSVLHHETTVVLRVSKLLSSRQLAASHDFIQLFLANLLNFLLFMHIIPVKRLRLHCCRLLSVIYILLLSLLISQLIR